VNTEAAILERIIEPEKPELNKALAEYLLSLDFQPGDHERMNRLSEKAQEGRLSADEQRELDSYLSMGHFLAMLQSKARITLKRSNGTT
jgi:hypothetical protein